MKYRSALPVAILLGTALGGIASMQDSPEARARSRAAFALVADADAAPAVTWDIPMVRNDAVDQFVELFAGRQSKLMARYLKRSGRYEGMVRTKLRERGMPEDLAYLSMIESGFDPNAVSSAKAVGLWQFMSATGRGYGLRVDGYVDERRDPEKSTDAALRYLGDLHDTFGSWYLAAAAYNAGAGRVGRDLKAATGQSRAVSEADFWKIRPRLPKETREYVPLMLAAALIGKQPAKYGLGAVSRWLPLEADTVKVPGGIPLSVVARSSGATPAELAKLNPQLIQRMTPPGAKPYPVRIPEGRVEQFSANFDREYRVEMARQEAQAAREREAARVARIRREARERVARREAQARRARLAARKHTTTRSRASTVRRASARRVSGHTSRSRITRGR